MSELDTYLGYDYPVELRKLESRFHLTQFDLNLVASGDDLDAAYADLDRKKRELFEHHARQGTLSRLPAPSAERLKRALTPFFIKAATVAVVGVVLLSVASFSFTYALREPLRKVSSRTAKAALATVAKELNEFANDPQSKAREEKIRLAIRAALPKLKPYVDELRPLFTDPGDEK